MIAVFQIALGLLVTTWVTLAGLQLGPASSSADRAEIAASRGSNAVDRVRQKDRLGNEPRSGGRRFAADSPSCQTRDAVATFDPNVWAFDDDDEERPGESFAVTSLAPDPERPTRASMWCAPRCPLDWWAPPLVPSDPSRGPPSCARLA